MKQLLTISILLLTITQAGAQSITPAVEAGFTFGRLTGRDIDSLSNGGPSQSLKGLELGFTLHNKITKHFSLRHSLFYSNHNTPIRIDDGLHPVFKSKLRRQYLTLFPASPAWQWGKFQVYGGPYIGVLLSASLQRKDSNGNLYTDKSFFGDPATMSNYSQKFDAGLEAGVAYTLTKSLYINARLVRGFVPLIEDASKQPQWRIYNYNLIFTIGYQFAAP
jgi:hypothetical protein